MAANKQLNELLNREMDRRDFLKHLGLGTIAIFGLGSAVKLLTSIGNNTQPVASGQRAQSSQALSYGSGAYGGKRPA